MNWLGSLFSRVRLACLLVILGASSARAAVPNLAGCSWPFESTGRGITNVATPDTHATYWIMPLDTNRWTTMVVQGRYPEARFFNFNSYTATGSLVDTIADSNIAPDPGGANPFATPTAAGPGSYTLTISANSPGSANSLRVGGGGLAFIVYRVYLPDQGLDRTGGVGVPATSLVAADGSVQRLQPCPFADAETSLGNLVIMLAENGFVDAANFLQTISPAASQSPLVTGACNPGQPGPAPVTFAIATLGANFFANPQTTYLETPGFCFQTNKVVVVRGKAFVFPNTYPGGSVFQPAFDDQIQVRYWSMYNNDRVIPYTVIACQPDFATKLDESQSYTYVISNDQAPPPWLPDTATWLPWGNTTFPKNLIFRIILPGNGPVAMDDYPVGVFCDEALFIQQGWQACFAAAGISGPVQ